MFYALTLASTLAVAALAAEGEYNYYKMGADWGGTCATGREQSPINFHDFGMMYSEKINLQTEGYINYSPATVTKGKDTVKASGITTGSFTKTFWDGSTSKFVPLQFHFHAPSEHTIGGRHMDLELHVVHLYEDGSLGAVIGIFFDTTYGGTTANQLIGQLGVSTLSSTGTSRNIAFANFMQGLPYADFYSYDGSLTTPPCTEGIKWSVLKQIQSISPSQLAEFNNLWKDNNSFAGGMGNNRIPQPWNRRAVLDSSAYAKKHLPVYDGASVLTASASVLLAASVLTSLF